MTPSASTSDPTTSASTSTLAQDKEPQETNNESQSSFATASTSLRKPPVALLSSSATPHLSPSSSSLLSPLLLDSLTRSTLPFASLTESHAKWVDWSRPTPSDFPAPDLIQLAGTPVASTGRGNDEGPAAADASKRPKPNFRRRSASVGSLQALIERDRGGMAALGQASTHRRKSSEYSRRAAGTSREPRPTSTSGDKVPQAAREGDVSQLSWGKWWPFAVVEPNGTPDRAAPPPPPPPPLPAKGAKAAASRDFLSLFAGTQAVDEARRHQAERAEQDRLEAELLDASLEELDLSAGSLALEADEVMSDRSSSPRRDKALPPPPPLPAGSGSSPTRSSFLPPMPTLPSLPNLFSSPGATAKGDASASTKATSDKGAAGPSLLSSFAPSNPFASSASTTSTSSSSFFPSGGSSRSPPRFNGARLFSSSGANKKEQDDSPDTKASEAKKMVDGEDRETIRQEQQVDLDTFSLLKDKYRTPKLPIVFCHGLFGFDYIGPAAVKPLRFSYWIGVEEALQAMGVEVLIGRVPASASIEERAKVLCQMIGEKFPGQDVNLVGHSMGGLDGRFLISRLKPTNFRVRSLTTISTPHRGSSFADYLLEDIVGVERVPALLGAMSALGVPGGGKAFDDLTTTKMARFNEETPDDPNVRYFSYGAYFEPSWSNAFRIPWGVVYEREGANDGLVSVDSAKWGDYRATLENVNHLDLVGWIGKFRYSFAAWSGNDIKFRPVSFYCAVAEQLADEGL